jgi:hypothetical protein
MFMVNSLCDLIILRINHGLHGMTQIVNSVGTGLPPSHSFGGQVRLVCNWILKLSALSVLSEAGERKNKTAESINGVITVHKGGNS